MIKMDQNIGLFLRDAFLKEHAAHAYIVMGEKQQLPKLLQQCALICICENHQGDQCDSCKKVLANVHQDVLTFPQDSEKSRLSVADIAVLVEECNKRPVDNSDCRVFLVNAANSTVGVGAEIWQNKLLKTLEEPTENTYIFIGVTDAEALLPTIRSRCQVLKQSKHSPEQICTLLQGEGFEKRYCEVAASVCGGSLETAESIMSNPAVLRAFNVAVNLAENMTSTKNALPHVSAVLAERDYVIWVFNFLTVLLRESIVFRLADELCLLPSHKSTVEKICANYSLQAAEVCLDKINSAKKRLDDGGNVSVVTDQLISSLLEVKFRCRI